MIPEILQDVSGATTAMMRYKPFSEAPILTSRCDRRIVLHHDPYSAAAEQYRRIATRIVTRHPAGGILMVTSPTPGDGKTLSATNLAFCLAERGTTLLVDFDLRHCSVHQTLGISPASSSLEDVLRETARPEDCILSIPETKLCVAQNRGQGQPSVNLIGTGHTKTFLDWAMRNFIWVILDTPPAFPIADTLDIAQHASVGLLVVRSRKTPSRLVKQAMESLKGRLQFVLLNDGEAPNYSIYNKSYYFEPDGDVRRWK